MGSTRRRLLLAMLPALAGCKASLAPAEGYCAPPGPAAFSLTPDAPPAEGATSEAQMAAMLGLSGTTAEQVGQSSEARLHVVARMDLATLALEATAAELDCEGERAEQAAGALAKQQTKVVQTLTINSIALGAVTGILGVLLANAGRPAAEQDTVAIAGGSLTAGLGLSSLFVSLTVPFRHSRNMLADVWTGPATSTTYPPFVWAYLTRRVFSNGGRIAIREGIVARWKQREQVADPATAATLFGAGGKYDVDALHARAAMLDEVRTEVELVHQDLAVFAATLVK